MESYKATRSWLCITTFALLSFVASCSSTKHVVYHIETETVNKTLTVKGDRDLTRGVVFALPRTVVAVTVPIEKTSQDFGDFWKEYVEEVFKSEIDDLFKSENLDRTDKTKEKQVRALEGMIYYSTYNAFNKPDSAQGMNYLTNEAPAETDPKKDLKPQLITAGYTAAQATALLRNWGQKATSNANFAASQANLKAFANNELKKAGLSLTVPGPAVYQVKKPSFATSSEPDPEHVYFIEIAGKFLEDRMLTLELSENGSILSGESQAADKTFDTVVKGIETAAGIAGRFVKGYIATRQAAPGVTVLEKAKQIVTEIESIRQDRTLLQTGKSTFWYGQVTFELYEKMLQEALKAEAVLVAYFHNKVPKIWNAQFEMRPSNASGEELFKLWTNFGISLGTNHKLASIPEDGFIAENPTGEFSVLRLNWSQSGPGNVSIGNQSVLRAVAAKIESQNKAASSTNPLEWGLRHRVPGIAVATIVAEKGSGASKTEKILALNRLAIAQFGVVFALPAETGHYNSKFTTAYYPDTGALKKLVVDSKSIDGATTIKTLGDAAGGVAQSAIDREHNLLKKKKEMLEFQDKIDELRDKASK